MFKLGQSVADSIPPPTGKAPPLAMRTKYYKQGCNETPVISTDNCLTDERVLQDMFEAVSVSCPTCLARLELTVTTKPADTWLLVEYKVCHHEVFSSSPKAVSDSKFSENNVKLVSISLQTRGGYDGYSRAATTTNTKPVTRRDYHNIQSCVGRKIFAHENHYQDIICERIFEH